MPYWIDPLESAQPFQRRLPSYLSVSVELWLFPLWLASPSSNDWWCTHVSLQLLPFSQTRLSVITQRRVLDPVGGKEAKEVWFTLTRRSQAFFGMSFKSARRSSCSFSNNSLPIGPVAASLMGLSLNELYKASKQERQNINHISKPLSVWKQVEETGPLTQCRHGKPQEYWELSQETTWELHILALAVQHSQTDV